MIEYPYAAPERKSGEAQWRRERAGARPMKCLSTRTTPEGFKRRRYQSAGGVRHTTIEVPVEVWQAINRGVATIAPPGRARQGPLRVRQAHRRACANDSTLD